MRKIVMMSVAAVSSCVISCAPTLITNAPESGPVSGIVNNSVIAVKDYEVRGIIFSRSAEKVEKKGSKEIRTGSPVTYEMLMIEAQKLGADDIMNVRTDVYVEHVRNNFGSVISTTYTHAASAVAIKYTNAVPVDYRVVANPRLVPPPSATPPAAAPPR